MKMQALNEYLPGEKVEHAKFGVGRIIEIRSPENPVKWVMDFPDHGVKTLLITPEQIIVDGKPGKAPETDAPVMKEDAVPSLPAEEDKSFNPSQKVYTNATPGVMESARMEITKEELKSALREVLEEDLPLGNIEMGDRWHGGKLVIVPGKDGAQEKEIPLEMFFRKIVMVRERLRVLEQKINNNEALSDEDRIEMQQYITRVYGTLTTFNVLFKNRGEWFVGQKG